MEERLWVDFEQSLPKAWRIFRRNKLLVCPISFIFAATSVFSVICMVSCGCEVRAQGWIGRFVCLLILLWGIGVTVWGQESFPCVGTATTVLNVRSGPSTRYARVGQLKRGEQIKVLARVVPDWVRVEYDSKVCYVNSNYLRFSSLPATPADDADGGSWTLTLFNWVCASISLVVFLGILYLLLRLLLRVGIVLSRFLAIAFKWFSLPFFLLNALQRYLAKPWLQLMKRNRLSDADNATLRQFLSVLKIPLYIALFPVRLANAVFFNILVHNLFEFFNYVMEVYDPYEYREGSCNRWKWIYMFPWRLLKYPLWHGTLTLIESLVWTVVDTVLPALTLFHGTTSEAAEAIVSSPDRGDSYQHNTGIWMVGGGNYAGNGIYFAPARSTAVHYSRGSLIVCRVTLGRTLDLGLAPRHVFNACGHPDALVATDWGLRNGYVTGEWWRADAGWWEYCMYDWQNRYNLSWRIRPLYVMDLEYGGIQRIPGGMCHWLFRKMVIKDICSSLGV